MPAQTRSAVSLIPPPPPLPPPPLFARTAFAVHRRDPLSYLIHVPDSHCPCIITVTTMAPPPSLTHGALQRILNGERVERPVLQVLAYKKVDATGNDKVRVRFIMSDGRNSHQCCIMMADDLIERVKKGDFERYTIIRLDDYEWNDIKDNKKVLVMKSPVLLMKGDEVGGKQDNPTPINERADPVTSKPGSGPVPTKRPAVTPAASVAPKRPAVGNVIPIAHVNQFQRGLSVKGRVTAKTGLKHWTNERGSGCLFNFDLQDDTGAIRVAAFKEKAESLIQQVQIGQVVIISKPQVKSANKKFSTLPHDCELAIGDDSVVVAGDENDDQCPQMHYKFVPLRQIENAENQSFVDIVAVVHRVNDVSSVIQKSTQKELKKRDLVLVDESAEITLTLWGRDAEEFAGQAGDTVIFTKAKVSDYSGKSLNSGSMQLNPNHADADRLREWYEVTKDDLKLISLTQSGNRETPNKLLFQILHETLTTDAPVYAQVRVSVVHFMRTSHYDACPADKCKKRVVDMNNGMYRCEKCNRDFETPQKRFVQAIVVADPTGDLLVSMFHDDFLKFTNITEEEVNDLTGDDAKDRLEGRVAETGCKQYIVKLRVFRDTYNDKLNTRANVLSITPVDFAAQGRRLLSKFRALTSL